MALQSACGSATIISLGSLNCLVSQLVKAPGVHLAQLETDDPVNLENLTTALYPVALEETAKTSSGFGIPAMTLAAKRILS